MPPLVSDDEGSSDVEMQRTSPVEKKRNAKKEEPEEEDADDDAEDAGSGEEGEEEEYVVEKIISHAFDDNGNPLYEVKWLGYEKKSDRTWEPEDNLQTAQEVLQEYFEKIGGRPEPGQKKERKRRVSEPAASTPASTGRGRGRKKAKTEDEEGATPTSTTATRRKTAEDKWEPPKGSWENDILAIDTVEERINKKTGEKEKYVYVIWNNTKKTLHAAKVIHQKCPQKLIQYYEQHLVFKNGPDYDSEMVNGD